MSWNEVLAVVSNFGALCPRCDTAVAARQAFAQRGNLEQVLGAVIPFVVVVLASMAIGRLGTKSER
jgi:hypothetical protein